VGARVQHCTWDDISSYNTLQPTSTTITTITTITTMRRVIFATMQKLVRENGHPPHLIISSSQLNMHI
jgi:hypothetical protein